MKTSSLSIFSLLTSAVLTSPAQQVRKDKRCGSSFNNAICATGECCSQYDWCGTTTDHCLASNGCQSAFGQCSGTSSSSNISPNAKCGGGKGYTCLGSPWGDCCSQYGWCGSSSAYCGTGCQSVFGSCSGQASSLKSSILTKRTTSSSQRSFSTRTSSVRSSTSISTSIRTSSARLSSSIRTSSSAVSSSVRTPSSAASSSISRTSSSRSSSINTPTTSAVSTRSLSASSSASSSVILRSAGSSSSSISVQSSSSTANILAPSSSSIATSSAVTSSISGVSSTYTSSSMDQSSTFGPTVSSVSVSPSTSQASSSTQTSSSQSSLSNTQPSTTSTMLSSSSRASLSISSTSSSSSSSAPASSTDALENPASFTITPSSESISGQFVDASDAHSGTKYLRVTSTGNEVTELSATTTVQVQQGVTYLVSLWVRSVGVAGCSVTIEIDDTTVATSGNSVPFDWTEISGSWTSDSSSPTVTLLVSCPAESSLGVNRMRKRQSTSPGLDLDDLNLTETDPTNACFPTLIDPSFEISGPSGTSADWQSEDVNGSSTNAHYIYAHPGSNGGQGDGSYGFSLWTNSATVETYDWNYLHTLSLCKDVAYQFGLVLRTYVKGSSFTEGCRLTGFLDDQQAFSSRVGVADELLRYVGGQVEFSDDRPSATLKMTLNCPTNIYTEKTRGIMLDAVHVKPASLFTSPSPTPMYTTTVSDTNPTSTFPYTTSCVATQTVRPARSCIQPGELIQNPSFEDCSPSSWYFKNAGAAVLASSGITTDDSHTGSQSFKAVFGSGGGFLGISFNGFVPCPERNYKYSFWVKASGSSCVVRQLWGTHEFPTSSAAPVGQWNYVEITLTDPYNQYKLNFNEFELRLQCNEAASVWLDDVSFVQLTLE